MAGTTVELLGKKKVRRDNTTGVTGVTMYRGKYKSVIHFQGKTYCLGTYVTLADAAAARKEAEKCLFREFLEFFERWRKKAEVYPKWGEENPVSFSVTKTEMGNFNIIMRPQLD